MYGSLVSGGRLVVVDRQPQPAELSSGDDWGEHGCYSEQDEKEEVRQHEPTKGAWPFGLVETVWSIVAVRRWWIAAERSG